MKILVLMPLDEKWTFIATALWQKLSPKAKQVCFAMPMFTEWQQVTKKYVFNDIPQHWNTATFGTIIKAREVYKAAENKHEDIIIIGNMSPDYKFDVIFNFQDPDKDLPYEDKYLQKLREVFNVQVLKDALTMYDASASTMTLHNTDAAAAFLSAYLETDPRIDDIKAKYQDLLEKFKGADSYAA